MLLCDLVSIVSCTVRHMESWPQHAGSSQFAHGRFQSGRPKCAKGAAGPCFVHMPGRHRSEARVGGSPKVAPLPVSLAMRVSQLDRMYVHPSELDAHLGVNRTGRQRASWPRAGLV